MKSVYNTAWLTRTNCLQEGFIRQYDVKFRRPAELPEAKCEDMNSIKVALKYGQTNGRQKLTKGALPFAMLAQNSASMQSI